MSMTLKVVSMLAIPMIVSAGLALSAVQAESEASVKSMEQVFFRTDQVHKESVAQITRDMTSTEKAMQVLEKANLATPAVKQVVGLLAQGKGALRKQPKGYAGLDGARKMLNDMIFESMSKYDSEIQKCTDFYSKQCAAMDICRGTIAESNYIAANSRGLILDSQSTINQCENDIPTTKQELFQHNLKCKHELDRLRTREKLVLDDIGIMTGILKMTDCEKKSFVQEQKLALLRCEDECTKTGKAPAELGLLSFSNEELKNVMSHLKSSSSQELVKSAFADMYEGMQSLERLAQSPVVNKTSFNNPPLPITRVPSKPQPYPRTTVSKCGCYIGKNPMCYKLQGRFLLIQAGIQDEYENILKQIDDMERICEKDKQTLETEISDDESRLDTAQTKLAQATEKEATAGETARLTAEQHMQLEGQLVTTMKKCTEWYMNFESELCALKKIRGELYKMKGGPAGTAFFQDCEVSAWEPEECSKVCAGGDQRLSRNVLVHPNKGAKCLPLAAERSCNNLPCPVDCKLEAWTGWSKCSADCGGGVQQRLREVKQGMKFGGKPCGPTSEAIACNPQACEKDCGLTEWTAWNMCSKDCDGGTQKRQKFIKTVVEGAGQCPDKWSPKRLEYKKCSMGRCALTGTATLMCNRTFDVVLLLDGSAPMGKKGFKNELKAATQLIDAFAMPTVMSQVAVIMFSGPKTWSGVSQCTGKSTAKVNQEKVCKIKTVSHFTKDLKELKGKVNDLEFPKGGSLTSLGLFAAKAELGLGRAEAKSMVVVFSAGRPLSYRKTGMASRQIRKMARLLWVAVSRNTPLASIKKWATRRWQENVVHVESFKRLADPSVITHVVANICPNESGGLKFSRKQ